MVSPDAAAPWADASVAVCPPLEHAVASSAKAPAAARPPSSRPILCVICCWLPITWLKGTAKREIGMPNKLNGGDFTGTVHRNVRSVPHLDDRKYRLLESIEAAKYFLGNILFTFKLQLK